MYLLDLHPTLGGGDIRAFFVVEINIARNLGLIGILDSVSTRSNLLTCNGTPD